MNAKIISSTLACLVLGSSIATTGCGQKQSSGNDKDTKSARDVVGRKSRVSELTGQIDNLKKQNQLLISQRDAAQAKAQMVRVKVLNTPEDIIKELPGLYGSNDSAFQRRRIHLTESLVDSGEGSLDAIETFLNQGQDTEPDIAADRRKRQLDRYGITDEQYVLLQTSIAETLEVMKPTLDADKDRRDAERATRREADEKRRDEFRGKMREFSATLEGLSEEERRGKMGEWFREQRSTPESVARREQEEKDRDARREQERKDREARGPTATDNLRTAVEANTKVVIGAEKFEVMQNDRSLGRLISEIGGSDYREAVGGGSRGDWGRGRGGDRGRGGR